MEKLYVLGYPVGHSKSPAMHNAAYRALGLDWEYGFAECPTVEEARAFLARGDWLALNITMPYKPLALQTAAQASDAAVLAQGANVLVRRKGELLADNTDGKGCITYLRRCGVEFPGAQAVVCGTGPTSLSIMHAVAAAGASRVTLLGRNAGKADRALDDYLSRARDAGIAIDTSFQAGAYGQMEDAIAHADIILDATPLGMKPNDPAPIDTTLLSSGQTVFDVVYGHGETALLAAARAVGCGAFNGEGMLVAQAVETVRDIVEWLDIPVGIEGIDLFEIMHDAAFLKS